MSARWTVTAALVLAVAAACSSADTRDDRNYPRNAAEFDAFFDDVSNWGRWGPDDQLGTFNLITPEKRRAAAALVRSGVSVSLSHNPMPDEAPDNPDAAFDHVMGDSLQSDTYTFTYHGYGVSHIDSLCHIAHKDRLYNDVPKATNNTADGCGKFGIEQLKNGIVSRGVLLDMARHKGVPYLEPGTAIYADDIEAWEQEAGVTVSAGDVIFIRTGRWARRAEVGPWSLSGNSAGIHASVVRWIKERDVAYVGSDAATDVQPSLVEDVRLPVHTLLVTSPRHEPVRQHGSGGARRDRRAREPLGVPADGRADSGRRRDRVAAQRHRGVLSERRTLTTSAAAGRAAPRSRPVRHASGRAPCAPPRRRWAARPPAPRRRAGGSADRVSG